MSAGIDSGQAPPNDPSGTGRGRAFGQASLGPSTSRMLTWLLVFSIAVAVAGFVIDWKNTLYYGGVDLRNRVVGSRLLREGLDPYFHEWKSDEPDRLLDPNVGPGSPASMVTVTPALLAFQEPVAQVHYKWQRIGWSLLQWAMMLASTALLAQAAPSSDRKKAVWIAGLLIIAGSYFWHLHIERGQIYILYVFLISAAFRLCALRQAYARLIGGALLGVTGTFWPPAALMLLPMLVYRKWKVVAGGLAGAAVSVLVSLAAGGVSAWISYYRAARVWSDVFLGVIQYQFVNYSGMVVEGMDNLTWRADAPQSTYDGSTQAILQLTGLDVPSGPLMISMIVVVVASAVFMWKQRSAGAGGSMPVLFLMGATLMLAVSYLLPARRFTYTDVLWLLPLAFIVISAGPPGSLIRSPLAILFFTGIFFEAVFWMPYSSLISEYAMMAYFIAMTAVLARRFYPGGDSAVGGRTALPEQPL